MESKKTEKTVAKETVSTAEFFEVAPEFKVAAMGIIGTRPFAEVSNQMAILRKETLVYHIEEINIVIGYLGDLPYQVVAKFFDNVRGWVKEHNPTDAAKDEKLAPKSEKPKSEKTEAEAKA